MKQIQLLELTLINFKGIRNNTIKFSDNTNVYGDNATGKTSIFDAFTWLLFGKDSTDAKEFGVKTLDTNNKVIPKLEHEVTGTLFVDGTQVILKRCLREKWTKKAGRETTEFTGNETVLFYNDVPLNATEYKKKIDEIVSEDLFKILTNVGHFNSLKWQERRNILIGIAGTIDEEQLISGDAALTDIYVKLNKEKKTVEELKKEIAAKKAKLKTELELIPARIDEVKRGIPALPNEEEINNNIALLRKEIAAIDKQIEDKTQLSQATLKELEQRQKDKFAILEKMNGIEFKIRSEIQAAEQENKLASSKGVAELTAKSEQLTALQTKIRTNELKIANIELQKTTLREKYAAENAKELIFSDTEFCCPACKRMYESEDIAKSKDEMIAAFNKNKLEKLTEINEQGLALKQQAELLSETVKKDSEQVNIFLSEIKLLEVAKTTITVKEITPFKEQLLVNADYLELQKQIEAINNLPAPEKQDVSALKANRQEYLNDIEQFNNQLSAKQVIEKAEKRIAELLADESKFAQELSQLEKSESSIAKYIKLKIDFVTDSINRMFKYVQFKMFNELINGNVEECCDTLINGVPYSDANSGSKINAGIDIINVLSKYYNLSAPMFVDNAESTTRLIPTINQLTRLVVSEQDKTLRIENN